LIKIKILLLFPKITVNKGSVKKCDMPFGLGYVASYLKNNRHNVGVVDVSLEGYENEIKQDKKITFGLSDSEIFKRIGVFKPELVGISCPYSLQFHNVVQLSKLVKEAGDIPVAIGGVHPTFSIEEIDKIKTIDFVIFGEGEQTFLELADKKPLKEIKGLCYRENNKMIKNQPRELIKDLDNIPFPARELFNMEKYIQINKPHNPFPKKKRVASIMTSRGCYGNCTFCSSHLFWGYPRYRSVDNIIAEIKELIANYQIEEIQILDDNLTGDKQRAKELFKEMKDLGIVWCTPNGVRIDTIDEEMLKLMKQSGCYRLTYAIESGDEQIQKSIKKNYDLNKAREIVKLTKKEGIEIHTFWIIGFPDETEEQMQRTFDFAKSLKTNSSSFCLATPMIGTKLLETCKRENLLEQDFDVKKANYVEPSIKNQDISREELKKLCDKFNTEINKDFLFRNPIGFLKKYGRVRKNMFKKYS